MLASKKRTQLKLQGRDVAKTSCAPGPAKPTLACVVGHILRPQGNMPATYNKAELHMGWRTNKRAHLQNISVNFAKFDGQAQWRPVPLLSLRIGCTTSRGRGAWHEIEAWTAENTHMRAMA